MKPLSLLILALMLTACGSAGASDPAEPGIILPSPEKVTSELSQIYEEAQACSGMVGESFETLRIEVVTKPFTCTGSFGSQCAGEYFPPNSFMVVSPHIFRHEVFHYLLDLLSDSDTNHEDAIWKTDCPKL